MAKEPRRLGRSTIKGGIPTFFFLDVQGEGMKLHKRLGYNRGLDSLIAWRYDTRQRVTLSYTFAKENLQRGWTTPEVAQMVNRSYDRVRDIVRLGEITPPEMARMTTDPNAPQGTRVWSEDSIWELHYFLSTIERGRPRDDGGVRGFSHDSQSSRAGLPTPQELRAALRNEETTYVKNANGEFVPVWRAQDFS